LPRASLARGSLEISRSVKNSFDSARKFGHHDPRITARGAMTSPSRWTSAADGCAEDGHDDQEHGDRTCRTTDEAATSLPAASRIMAFLARLAPDAIHYAKLFHQRAALINPKGPRSPDWATRRAPPHRPRPGRPGEAAKASGACYPSS
jgi:hypothetical protein